MLGRVLKALAQRLFPDAYAHLATRKSFYEQFYGRIGEYELRLVKKFGDRDKLAIDIGAHKGVYAFHMRRFFGKVVAFEPNPTLVEQLKRTFTGKGVRIESAALSSSRGRATLYIPRLPDGTVATGWAALGGAITKDASDPEKVEVDLRPLDSYGFVNVGLVKIDVEGHEERVLEGARQTITSSRPVLIIEIEERHNSGGINRIARWLADFGYSGYFFEGGNRRALADFDPSRHQNVDALAKERVLPRQDLGYVNNFLFLPPLLDGDPQSTSASAAVVKARR